MFVCKLLCWNYGKLRSRLNRFEYLCPSDMNTIPFYGLSSASVYKNNSSKISKIFSIWAKMILLGNVIFAHQIARLDFFVVICLISIHFIVFYSPKMSFIGTELRSNTTHFRINNRCVDASFNHFKRLSSNHKSTKRNIFIFSIQLFHFM